jgi:hypothetical protein
MVAASAGDDSDDAGPDEGVIVPLYVYKRVTVVSTVFATVLVVVGFGALDAATNRGRAAADEIEVWLAAIGLACIVVAAGIYAFAARFRTAEMGSDKTAATEESDNG